MAGLAEAAISFGLFICWCALFVIAVLLFFAWYRESWRFALGAAILVLILGIVFQPWSAFIPTPKGFASWSNDPDYLYWRARERLMCVAWAVVLAAAAFAVVHYAKHKRNELPSV
jgi:hypothetical protein